ncbi:Mitochondrial ornithine carrier protein AmcA/O.t1.c1 [Penicillium atrosanguineum]|uniref:Mitochondrial ornithine carrier protein AmcA/O.t1.c1 n=1 Tax=Penicillium atrosanguineum TaxID=1132637 RepID=UPI0023A6D612|nr:Mitochondrial ornithine carrier protein AmcA/O.t1.c1 [Penicillium atrosanguineum]KAJ5289377.1 Mitochondrial ornithine carrier protein AmcA/O.t1.c1 [Penicillium atrosanguineum]
MPGSSSDPDAIRQALDRARDCEDGPVDPSTSAILEAALAELWSRISAAPDTYVPSPDEFALFNYFLHRFQGNPLARRVVGRFWDNYQAPPNTDGNNK